MKQHQINNQCKKNTKSGTCSKSIDLKKAGKAV